MPADLASASDCENVVSETASTFGGLDILCNNVGIQPPDSYLRVEDTPEGMWDRIIDVNLKSYFLMSKSAIPEIRKRRGGVVINTASVQGLQSMPGVPAYAASKGGVLSLTQQMSIDYAPREHPSPGGMPRCDRHAYAAQRSGGLVRGRRGRRQKRRGYPPDRAYRHWPGHRERGAIPRQRTPS